MRTRTLAVLLVVPLLTLSACRDPKIRTYRIPKEATPAPMAAAAAAASRSPVPSIDWEKPADWQEQPGNTMRIGSFLVTGSEGRVADMAVTTFPGDVGGDFANLNRWRGQIQLPPIGEHELATAITSLDLPAGQFQLIDITSDTPLIDGKYKARILGAWLKQPERTWFFKMAGESDLVGSQRETFLAFLRTVKFGAPETSAADTNSLPDASLPMPPPIPGVAPQDPHAGHNHAPGEGHPDQDSPEPQQDSGATWSAPAGWAPKPLGQMRKGSFAIRGDDGAEADLSITVLGAASNPLLDNINRWRGQLGLAPITEAQVATETTSLEHDGLTFTLVEFPGTPPGSETPTRLLGAILYRGPEAWFFKMTGPDTLVSAQKSAFIDFLKTVKTR